MRIEADGASLEVNLTGDSNKPAILLWHGAGCTLRMWDHVTEKLKDNFFIISFDIRGVGLSSADGSQSQYTFEKYSEDRPSGGKSDAPDSFLEVPIANFELCIKIRRSLWPLGV